jgi:hypothetical protein
MQVETLSPLVKPPIGQLRRILINTLHPNRAVYCH